MKDMNCPYCMREEKPELLDKFGIWVAGLRVSDLIFFREQSHAGRCIVAYRGHVNELIELSEAERNAFFEDVAQAAKAIHAVYHPDKINYGAYSDTLCHLHFHLVPKYRDGFEWGGVFAMNPAQTHLSDAEYMAQIEALRQAL